MNQLNEAIMEYLKTMLTGPRGKELTGYQLMQAVYEKFHFSFENQKTMFLFICIDIYLTNNRKNGHKWVNTQIVRKCNRDLEVLTGYQYLPSNLIGKQIWKYCKDRGFTEGKYCLIRDAQLKKVFPNKDFVNPTLEKYDHLGATMSITTVPYGEWEKTKKYLHYLDVTKEYDELLKSKYSNLMQSNQNLYEFTQLKYTTIDVAVNMVLDYSKSKKLIKNNVLCPDKNLSKIIPPNFDITKLKDLLKTFLSKIDIKSIPMDKMYEIAQYLDHRESHIDIAYPQQLVKTTESKSPSPKPKKKKPTHLKLSEWDAMTESMTNYKYMPRTEVIKLIWGFINSHSTKDPQGTNGERIADAELQLWGLHPVFNAKQIMGVLSTHCTNKSPVNIPENEFEKTKSYYASRYPAITLNNTMTGPQTPDKSDESVEMDEEVLALISFE